MKVSEIMVRPVATAQENETLEAVARTMFQHDINRLPVVRGKQPVGIIARHDLLKLMLGGTRASSPGT